VIRPSALQLAEKCGLASRLAEQFPEASPAADRGTAIHEEIASGRPQSLEAIVAVLWLGKLPGDVSHDVRVTLADPETGDVITRGTADLVASHGDDLLVVDWKTGRPEFVAPAAENLQLHAYGLAVALDCGLEAYRVALGFLDGDQLTLDEAPPVKGAEMWTMFNRIKAAAARPPVASPGEHCARCWSRVHCHAWRDRVTTALALLPGEAVALTDETATALALRLADVKKAAEVAEEMVKAHVRGGGRVEHDGKIYAPSMVAGRKTADVKALEAAGLGQYVKQGAGYETWKWRRA
jgi:hypothetical protein